MSMATQSHGILSPAASVGSPGPGIIQHVSILPKPRSSPLKPGSPKEIALVNFIDEKILRITRRYAKKFSNSTGDDDDDRGYTTFEEAARDLEAAFDLVWISGTPSLQIPYLLNIAGLFCGYMPAFPFSESTFPLARKLDSAFAYLIHQYPSTNSEQRSYHVSMTDKVRIKSLIEETRVVAVEVASESGYSPNVEDFSDDDEIEVQNEAHETEDDEYEDGNDEFSIGLGRIYRHTMDILGDPLV